MVLMVYYLRVSISKKVQELKIMGRLARSKRWSFGVLVVLV